MESEHNFEGDGESEACEERDDVKSGSSPWSSQLILILDSFIGSYSIGH